MFDKKDYRRIIQEGQIKRGYLSNPSFEDKLEEIIKDSFEELPLLLKKKQSDEEILEEFGDKDINELSEEEIIQYEKCLPNYIQSLPGSLRSTDPKELQDRLDEIDKRLGELDDEIDEEVEFQEFAQIQIDNAIESKEEAEKNLEDYYEREEQWRVNDDESQGEAIDESNDIIKDWDVLVNTANSGDDGEIGIIPEMPKVRGIYDLDTMMRMFGVDEFEFKGYLNSDEVEFIKHLADNVEEYANSGSYSGDITDWSMQGVDLADKMREFADKYDINKSPHGDELVALVGIARRGEPSEWQSIIERSNDTIERNNDLIDESIKTQAKKEKEKADFEENKGKTQEKLSQAERNLYNIP